MEILHSIKIPDPVARGAPVKAEDHNALIAALKICIRSARAAQTASSADIGVRKSDSGGQVLYLKKNSSRGSGGGPRFEFKGIEKIEDVFRVRIGIGTVLYNQISDGGGFYNTPKKRVVTAVYPTIEVDGNDIRMDDESSPTILLGNRENATVWLVVSGSRCYSVFDAESLVITDRGEKPPMTRGQVCVPIVDFDVETTGSGESTSKRAKNIYTWLQSDHQQPYICGEDDSDSDNQSVPDSSFPSNESSSGGGGSLGSASSSGGGPASDDCEVKARAYFVGTSVPSCLAPLAGAGCVPKPLNVNITAEFFRNKFPALGQKDCRRWVFGVKVQGATKYPAGADGDDEYVWVDDWQRTLSFHIKEPIPCDHVAISWRVKSFSAPSGPLDGTPFECCGKEWSGTETVRSYRGGPYQSLPKVCGASCSSCSSMP